MTATLEDLLARWDSGDGKPYKGSLIDWATYDGDGSEPPEDMGCMCAQGQVLHLIGGWTPKQLRVDQDRADREVAKLLNISVGHAILLRNINDSIDGAPSIVLTNPEKVLGDQAKIVLAFWMHMDRMTDEEWSAAWSAVGSAAWSAARSAAWSAAGSAARAAAWAAAGSAARSAARAAAEYACSEIQGAHLLREQGKPFHFLPFFGFDSPEAIPALPDNYGKVSI